MEERLASSDSEDARSGRRSGAVIACVVAAGLAVAAALWLAFWPCTVQVVEGSKELTPAGGSPAPDSSVLSRCVSLFEHEGPGVLRVLFLPAALVFWGLSAAAAGSRLLLWPAAILLLAFSIVTGFTVGLLFIPASVALLVAAVIQQTRTPRRA
ncbi:MAG: hypothetical protein ACRDI1_07350 [Actinomycetota bacterium]